MTFAAALSRLNTSMLRVCDVDVDLGQGSVSAMFDDVAQIEPLSEFGTNARQATLTVLGDYAASVPIGQSVSVKGVAYKIEDIVPDGYGLTVLMLSKS